MLRPHVWEPGFMKEWNMSNFNLRKLLGKLRWSFSLQLSFLIWELNPYWNLSIMKLRGGSCSLPYAGLIRENRSFNSFNCEPKWVGLNVTPWQRLSRERWAAAQLQISAACLSHILCQELVFIPKHCPNCDSIKQLPSPVSIHPCPVSLAHFFLTLRKHL